MTDRNVVLFRGQETIVNPENNTYMLIMMIFDKELT